MKALVTGGTGFVGSHVVDKLLAKNYEVRCIVRPTSNLQWLSSPDIELFYSSLLDPDRLARAAQDVDIVIHVAGSLIEKDWNGFLNSNVKPVRLLLDAARKSDRLKKFVLVSSTGAHGPSPDGHPKKEDEPCTPMSDYGRSKLEGERVAHPFFPVLPLTIVRPSAVYGPRDPNFVKLFKQVHAGVTPLIGAEEHYANLVNAEDLADGILLAAESETSSGQTYTLASKRPYPRSELMDTIGDVYGRRARALILPTGLALFLAKGYSWVQKNVFGRNTLLDPERLETLAEKYWVFDVTKAEQELGFKEAYSLKEGMTKTYAWYQERGWIHMDQGR